MDKDLIIPEIEQSIELNTMSQDAISNGMALQQMKTTHITQIAAQRPRSLNVVKNKIIIESNLAGEDFYYQWGSGKNSVLGISIQGAMILARNWQNCVTEVVNVEEKRDHTLYYASFVDYENNFSITRAHKIMHSHTIYGNFDDARKSQMRFEIGQSKAIRNVILSALPEWLKQAALQEAMSGVREKIEKEINAGSRPAVIEKLVKALAKQGIKEPFICDKFGIKESKALTLDDLVIMYGDLKAIQQGNEFASNLYPAMNAEKKNDKIDELKKNASEKSKVKNTQESKAGQKSVTEPEQKEVIDEETGEIMPETDNMEKSAFIEEWKAATPAARLNKFVPIKGTFNIELYCETEKQKKTKNFGDLTAHHQACVLWLCLQANKLESK